MEILCPSSLPPVLVSGPHNHGATRHSWPNPKQSHFLIGIHTIYKTCFDLLEYCSI